MNKDCIGISTVNGYPFMSLKERYALYRQVGFGSIMVWWGEGEIETRAERVSLANEYGLYIENAHANMEHSNSLWMPGPRGDEKVTELIESVEDCKDYDIPCLIVHLTNGDHPPDITEIGLQRLEMLFESAIKNDITLAFENVRTEAHLRYVLDHYQDKHIVFCYDSGHSNLWNKDIDWLSLYSNRLAAIHLHDNKGKTDEHSCPFSGTMDWKNIMHKIKESSYKGSLTLETEYRSIENVNHLQDFLATSYRSGLELGKLLF